MRRALAQPRPSLAATHRYRSLAPQFVAALSPRAVRGQAEEMCLIKDYPPRPAQLTQKSRLLSRQDAAPDAREGGRGQEEEEEEESVESKGRRHPTPYPAGGAVHHRSHDRTLMRRARLKQKEQGRVKLAVTVDVYEITTWGAERQRARARCKPLQNGNMTLPPPPHTQHPLPPHPHI